MQADLEHVELGREHNEVVDVARRGAVRVGSPFVLGAEGGGFGKGEETIVEVGGGGV